MKEDIRKISRDETGSVTSPEILIMIIGVVIVSGIILKTISNPFKSLHQVTTENITKISRGF